MFLFVRTVFKSICLNKLVKIILSDNTILPKEKKIETKRRALIDVNRLIIYSMNTLQLTFMIWLINHNMLRIKCCILVNTHKLTRKCVLGRYND